MFNPADHFATLFSENLIYPSLIPSFPIHEGRDHLLATGCLSRQNLLQGNFQLPRGHETFEF